MYEFDGLGEIAQEIFILDIVDWDVEVCEASGQRIVFVELPVHHRHNVCDLTVLQRLRPAQGYETARTWSASVPAGTMRVDLEWSGDADGPRLVVGRSALSP